MYVYRQRHVSNADTLDGSWWNENQNELAGMFNGGLDRDNLGPNVIDGPMVVPNAIVNIDLHATTTLTSADTQSTSWQTLDTFQLTLTTDALVQVDWSGTWGWTGAYSRATSADGTTYVADSVAIRVSVNGITVCESGPSEDKFFNDCVALLGNIALTAGAYTVRVEYQAARRNYYDLSLEGQCTNTLDFSERSLLIEERRR